MSYLQTVPEEEAAGAVREMYEKERSGRGYLPNFAKVFCFRPEAMHAFRALMKAINSRMDTRRFELVTLAAARDLRSTYCMLAHGAVLRKHFYDAGQVTEIACDRDSGILSAAEKAMMEFVSKLVADAASIRKEDIDGLHAHGFSDEEIFEIAGTAAVRCFFSKMLDALGAEPDVQFKSLEQGLRDALTVGRPLPL
jgi:uncharacterized peroxidase-related enzyme